jgi:restriction system protein
VHELIGVMTTQRATGAILVTSNEFTYAALKAAANCPGLELVDGEALRRMLGPRMPQSSAVPTFDRERWQPVANVAADMAAEALGFRSPRRRRGTVETLGALLLIKLLVPLILFLGLLWVVRGVIHDITVQATARIPTHSQPHAPTPAPTAELASTQGVAPAPPPVDAAELKRRNDEAMKVLEATTPELGHMPGSQPASVEPAR